MSALDYTLLIILSIIYITCIVTVAMITFQKGHWLLGIFGFFFPVLWLIGAVLPPKTGSSYERREAMRVEAQMNQYSQ